jgi:Abortive infection C-terminus
MAEPTTAQARFQMVGARAAVLDGPSAEAIERQIHAIENALESVPDFAFDLAKTLVETVCKTILEDIGHPADPQWDAPKIMRETTTYLSMLPPGHPNAAKARDSITKTINGLHTTVQGLCELRNDYGLASHGRDSFSARLDLRQATLAAQAADTIVSFLYRIHRDALMQTPGARVYYEDHADFNEAFDRDNETIRVSDLGLRPSEVLFKGDPGAYRGALNDHIAERDGTDDRDDPAAQGDGGQEAQ